MRDVIVVVAGGATRSWPRSWHGERRPAAGPLDARPVRGRPPALPNACGGANPTLTNQALATRTAEKIFATHLGGAPWVHTESPVVSTDSRITIALATR